MASTVAYLNGITYSFSLGYNSSLVATLSNSGQQMNLGGQLTSQPFALVMGNDIDIFGRGTDGAVYYRTLYNGWQSLGGSVLQILSVSRAYSYYDVQIRAVGTDNQVYTRSLTTGWVRSN